ncbi:hypothetical protein HU200_011354 [Digitaria exilis]|uniref:Uncharacterized protein n=1 Tax=Digitaria exilis TaxID=1010633 RepID=A0A835FGS5_9POAL|nr:hypothetical protein HU200_011354 [Digitaria exilis]
MKTTTTYTKPFDLEVRVQMLQNCVNDCSLPPSADEVEDMNVVLSDYLMLYFPTSQSRKRKAPLSPMHAVPEQKSVVIPVTHALKIWNDPFLN